jgi:hypothetical protein
MTTDERRSATGSHGREADDAVPATGLVHPFGTCARESLFPVRVTPQTSA